MRDIALMGYARSGKDTAGAHLVEQFGYERVSFADPVRESLLALNPIVDTFIEHDPGTIHRTVRGRTKRLSEIVTRYGWEHAKDAHPEVRRLLQAHGTDAVRGVIGDRVWVDLAMRKANAAYLDGRHTVVTDCRFPNEAEALRAEGFRLVWIDRPGVGPANNHTSETAVTRDDADVTLTNAGTLADLRARVAELAR